MIKLMYWIITIGTFLAGLVFILAVSPPAHATDDEDWWTWCGEQEKKKPLPNPGPAPRTKVA